MKRHGPPEDSDAGENKRRAQALVDGFKREIAKAKGDPKRLDRLEEFLNELVQHCPWKDDPPRV